MFGIGSTELLVILVIALLVLGPKNLPKIAQTIGKAMGQFQRVSKDFQRTLNTEVALEEEADKRKEQEKLVAEQEERKAQETQVTQETGATSEKNVADNTAKKTTKNTASATKKTKTDPSESA